LTPPERAYCVTGKATPRSVRVPPRKRKSARSRRAVPGCSDASRTVAVCGICDVSEQDDPKGTPGRGCIYADDWEQASHNGDLVHAVEAGVLDRDDVAELGDVLLGTSQGRRSDRDITVFDSTGLAIQDLAIALAALERAGGIPGLQKIAL
jgi:hypothetical protein